jgi:hypothetical protein
MRSHYVRVRANILSLPEFYFLQSYGEGRFFFARSLSQAACLYFLSKQISSNLFFPPELNAIKSLFVCLLGVLVCLVNWGLRRRGLVRARACCSPVALLKSIKMQYIFISPSQLSIPLASGC